MERYGVFQLLSLLILKLQLHISIGEQVALVGEEDDVVYAILDIDSIYKVDSTMKQLKFTKRMIMAHPGVNKLFSRSSTNVGGPIQLLNRPKAKKFEEFYL